MLALLQAGQRDVAQGRRFFLTSPATIALLEAELVPDHLEFLEQFRIGDYRLALDVRNAVGGVAARRGGRTGVAEC